MFSSDYLTQERSGSIEPPLTGLSQKFDSPKETVQDKQKYEKYNLFELINLLNKSDLTSTGDAHNLASSSRLSSSPAARMTSVLNKKAIIDTFINNKLNLELDENDKDNNDNYKDNDNDNNNNNDNDNDNDNKQHQSNHIFRIQGNNIKRK